MDYSGAANLHRLLVREANDALGNDTKHVLDCSTAKLVYVVLHRLALYQADHAEAGRSNAPRHAPDGYMAGYLDALDDTAIGTNTLARDVLDLEKR